MLPTSISLLPTDQRRLQAVDGRLLLGDATRGATDFHDPPAVNLQIETPDKANAIFIAQQNLSLRDDNPDYPALMLGGYMIGGGVMNSRLAKRISPISAARSVTNWESCRPREARPRCAT